MTGHERSTSDSGSQEPEPLSTVAVLHQHSLAPSTREKIVIPIVLLALAGVLAGVGSVVWDHLNRNYTPVATPGDLFGRARALGPEPGGFAGLLRPDDSRYVSLEIRGWQAWVGPGAVAQDHYLEVPGLGAGSLETLVKGDRGAAALRFEIDLRRTEGDRFFVDRIVRAGMATEEGGRSLRIVPLQVGPLPPAQAGGGEGVYALSTGILAPEKRTFEGTTRFTARGTLGPGDSGLILEAKTFKVALADPADPGVAALLGALTGPAASKNIILYLTLEEIFPWQDGKAPGRRQRTGQIGKARVDGIAVGRIYAMNP